MAKNSDTWIKNFQAYKRFISINLCFPKANEIQDEYPIGKWLSSQRNNFRRGKMSDEKKIMLDSVNPAWCLLTEERTAAENLMAIESPWKDNLPAGAIPIDEVIDDDYIVAGLIRRKVYDIKTVLDKAYFFEYTDTEVRMFLFDYDKASLMIPLLPKFTAGEIRLLRDIYGFGCTDEIIEFYESCNFTSEREVRNRFKKVLEILNDREYEIISSYYGIGKNGEDTTPKNIIGISLDMNMTKELARLIMSKALRKLRMPICRDLLQGKSE